MFRRTRNANRCYLGKLLLLVALFSLTACSERPQLTRLSADAVVLAFGDSLTYGTGVSPKDSYPSVLQRLIDVQVINAGISGEVTAEGLKRLPQTLSDYGPQLVILCHGGNDILRKYDPAQTKENLRAMIQLIRSHGAEVVLVAVPKMGLWPAAANYYEDLAEELHIPVEQDILLMLEKKPQYKSDSVHFNQEGYSRMARAIVELLRRSGAVT